MNFKDQIKADQAVFFNPDELADTVTYNTASTPIPAFFDFETGAGIPAEVAFLYVKMSDVPDPQYRDVFLKDGKEWRVFRDQNKGGVAVPVNDLWRIKVTAGERFKWT